MKSGKHWGMRIRKNSFSGRVLRVFLPLFFFLWAVYGGVYAVGYQMLTKEMTQMLYAKSSYVTEILENEIARIQRLQYECLNDDILYYTIGAYEILSKSGQAEKLLDIQERLQVLQESSAYIGEVIVYAPGIGRCISSVGGVTQIPEQKERQRETAPFGEGTLFYREGNAWLGAAYPHTTGAEPLFYLSIRLSGEALFRELNGLADLPEGGIRLMDSGGAFLLTAGEEAEVAGGAEDGEKEWYRERKAGDGKTYIVSFRHSDFLNMDVYVYLSRSAAYGNLMVYRNVCAGCLAVMMLMMGAYVYATHRVVNRPVQTLLRHIGQMEKGNLGVRIREVREDEFGYVYVAFNRMAESLENQMEINYRQKILTQQSELRYLQSQINPHFLYNSFFTLYRMAKDEDCESMVEFSSYLGEYYRYITKTAQADVPLEMEVAHAQRYAAIQGMRFQRRLKVEFEKLPPQFARILVPRLILHPVLENAFEHGLKDVEANGLVRVWFEQEGEKLLVHVEDNGAGMTKEQEEAFSHRFERIGEIIENGLCNINRRLKLKFGSDYGVRMRVREGGGTVCTLILPDRGKD